MVLRDLLKISNCPVAIVTREAGKIKFLGMYRPGNRNKFLSYMESRVLEITCPAETGVRVLISWEPNLFL